MKYRIFAAIFFAALTVMSGLMLNWGYNCPDCWGYSWAATACKVIGFAGLVAYPALAVREWMDEERFEEEED